MLNSILNITSLQQPDLTGKNGIQLDLISAQLGLQTQSLSQPPQHFAQQLNQMLPLDSDSAGKELPQLLAEKIERTVQNLTANLSQLERVAKPFDSTGKDLALQELDWSELVNPMEAETLLDAIQANLTELEQATELNITGENDMLVGKAKNLTIEQLENLTKAVDILQSKLEKMSQVLVQGSSSEAGKETSRFAITELYKQSIQAIQRTKAAIVSTVAPNKTHNETQLSVHRTISSFEVANSVNQSILPIQVEVVSSEAINRANKEFGIEVSNVKGELSKQEFLKIEQSKLDLLKSEPSKSGPSKSEPLKLDLSSRGNPTSENKFNELPINTGIQQQSKSLTSKANASINMINSGLLTSIAEPNSDARQTTLANPLETTVSKTIAASETAAQLTPSQLSASSNIQKGLSLRSDFTPNLAMRIQWIYQQALSSAEIMMDPPELGPLSVKMQHRAGEASMVFQVNNPQTKEMIEENLPKLKELLQQQGIALGDTQVKQNQQNTGQPGEQNNSNKQSEELADSELTPSNALSNSTSGLSLLDTYV
jgi:flagellar hook-length control protein FliK